MQKNKSNFPFVTVGISILLGCLFLTFFYLAVSNEPEYMPSQQQKQSLVKHQP
ncbi:hypothetical protein IAE19_09805 [Acinetobacter sp. S40]|uniref:hypothetical protein n=1 Tax=Acinetobacter sp. S40 TaxID=2767434 RepID=UPI0019098439|nr:hypothetical protein [Acinetobacter sp. S40]MBJ9985735.1 hypothetical protein [Acinetobacter sp. S40]